MEPFSPSKDVWPDYFIIGVNVKKSQPVGPHLNIVYAVTLQRKLISQRKLILQV